MENLTNKVESVEQNSTENAKVEKKPTTPADAIQSKVNANSTIKNLKQLVSVDKLTEAGAHIGLHPRKWNPKMQGYIHVKRSKNHVIDVLKTIVFLDRAYKFLQEIVSNGGKAMFVGTRGKIVKDIVQAEAERTDSFYVTQRWLGGTLTNFNNINNSIRKYNRNLSRIENDDISKYTKKEQLEIQKETDKLAKFYGGIKNMRALPDVIVIVDPVNDINAVREARKLKIPVIALANTNADPTLIDYIIPINNYAIKSIALILGVLADAIAEIRNEPTKVVNRKDEEIILPETRSNNKNRARGMFNRNYVRHYNPRNNFRPNRNTNESNSSEESVKQTTVINAQAK
ncbi:30S ribosomal protein S2 [Ureaplasma zalophigenitalium]|uniref:Small ribosomal subunit protein uS2 n=1 Tax=Ureaplasma zalophigenitalium TaxID=907723 RepID=A0ABT3BPS1_9BACT|nr:30S ribosomal protein S2 [Ureaplasma zalophigenitalium]MCV3754231.1 30S ribosomal protein S2 [Ureaplasma zalophigenitalium]